MPYLGCPVGGGGGIPTVRRRTAKLHVNAIVFDSSWGTVNEEAPAGIGCHELAPVMAERTVSDRCPVARSHSLVSFDAISASANGSAFGDYSSAIDGHLECSADLMHPYVSKAPDSFDKDSDRDTFDRI